MTLKRFGYVVLQLSWGLLQNIVGFLCFLLALITRRARSVRIFHGAVVTNWTLRSSMGMGLFVFFGHGRSSRAGQILVHEYGHTLQSAVLGPFFLPLVGLPSLIWAAAYGHRRRRRGSSYYQFYTEKWASAWGEKATGEPAAK